MSDLTALTEQRFDAAFEEVLKIKSRFLQDPHAEHAHQYSEALHKVSEKFSHALIELDDTLKAMEAKSLAKKRKLVADFHENAKVYKDSLLTLAAYLKTMANSKERNRLEGYFKQWGELSNKFGGSYMLMKDIAGKIVEEENKRGQKDSLAQRTRRNAKLALEQEVVHVKPSRKRSLFTYPSLVKDIHASCYFVVKP